MGWHHFHFRLVRLKLSTKRLAGFEQVIGALPAKCCSLLSVPLWRGLSAVISSAAEGTLECALSLCRCLTLIAVPSCYAPPAQEGTAKRFLQERLLASRTSLGVAFSQEAEPESGATEQLLPLLDVCENLRDLQKGEEGVH